MFCLCSLTAEPQPAWIPGGNHSRGSRPRRETGFLPGNQACSSPARPPWRLSGAASGDSLPSTSEGLRQGYHLQGGPRKQRPAPGVGASDGGTPPETELPALSPHPCLLLHLHYVPSLILRFLLKEEASSPSGEIVTRKQNKTIYIFFFFFFCLIVFFPRKLLN